MDLRHASPRAAALQFLAARYGSAGPTSPAIPLARFQLEAVERARRIITRRRGVLIADSVGLGKTFVALGLIELALARDESVLVVVPACLRRMWRTELRWLPGGRVNVVSHTQLALGHASGSAFAWVVVDEAHAFRTPATRRYRALRAVCRGARVVLLTATPVNNSLSDLYFQLRLFCSDGDFRDLGIGSLRETLKASGPLHERALERIRCAVVVRRTRADVRSDDDRFHFPAHVLTSAVRYELPIPPRQIGEFLQHLSLPGYRLNGRSGPSDLLRFGLLKRLESSVQAIRLTLLRQIRFYEEMLRSLAAGRMLDSRSFRSFYDVDDQSLQLVIEDVALEKLAVAPAELRQDVAAELATLREWYDLLGRAPDHKADALAGLLRARPAAARTIVFTEYRDTARYLWRLLRRRWPVGLLDGGGAWIGESRASRRQVIERFAPAANRVPAPPAREAIHVLVATDVLAEGMNLQDADAVVSYDLPWNPIRLIQRAGRIDRIGSPHEVVNLYNFVPDREFDDFIHLVTTIRRKLATVRAAVGLERPVLEATDDFETFARALSRAEAGLLDRIETTGDVLRAEYARERPDFDPGVTMAAAMAGASGRRFLVGLSNGADSRAVWLDYPDGRITEADDRDFSGPLGEPSIEDVDITRCGDAATRCIEQLEKQMDAVPFSTATPAARLARRLRELLAGLPLAQDEADVYSRADAVLERLAATQGVDFEDELGLLLRRPWTSAAELLGAVEVAFRTHASARYFERKWQAVAVIVAD